MHIIHTLSVEVVLACTAKFSIFINTDKEETIQAGVLMRSLGLPERSRERAWNIYVRRVAIILCSADTIQ